MNILIVTHYWHPHLGGIETVAREQARRLARRGHQVSVLTSRLPGDPAVSQQEGYEMHRVRVLNIFERFSVPFPLFSPTLLSVASRLVRDSDVTLAHGHTYLGSLASAIAARRQGRPFLLLQHNPFIEYRFPWNLIEHTADLLLGRFTLNSADRVLSISEHTADYVRKLAGRASIDLVYNGVDTSRFSPAPSPQERRAIRERLGLPADAFTFFTARRLVFRNGLDTLLDACLSLNPPAAPLAKGGIKGGYDDVCVVIAGKGPERGAMEDFLRRNGLRNVILAGFVPDDSLPDYYRAADAFVLPSLTGEGFGLVLLEAFASGIPAIATRAGAPEEIIDDGHTGFLIPPADAQAMARAMLTLKNQPERARDMGSAAYARAKDMDWEKYIDRLEELLFQAAGVGAPQLTPAD